MHLTCHAGACCAHAVLDMLTSEGERVPVFKHSLELMLVLHAVSLDKH